MEKTNSGYLTLHVGLETNDDNRVAIQSYFTSIGYRDIHIRPTHHEHDVVDGFGDDWYDWYWEVVICGARDRFLMDTLGNAFLEIEAKILRYKRKLWRGGY